jgi:hypothetical protein
MVVPTGILVQQLFTHYYALPGFLNACVVQCIGSIPHDVIQHLTVVFVIINHDARTLFGHFHPIFDTYSQTLEGYISKDIYIPYPIQKSLKRIFPYPFFEWDMLKDIISLF